MKPGTGSTLENCMLDMSCGISCDVGNLPTWTTIKPKRSTWERGGNDVALPGR
jgi:hypothetical protein